MVPLVNVAAVGMLAHGHAGRIALEVARNPLVLATLAGIAWNALRCRMPAGARAACSNSLANAALPLGLLAVGAALRFERDALPLPALAWFHVVKLGAMPAMALRARARARAARRSRPRSRSRTPPVPTATSAYILAARMNGTRRAGGADHFDGDDARGADAAAVARAVAS